MNKQIAIVTIPGIGTKEEGFDDQLRKNVERFTRKTALEGQYTFYNCRPFNETGIDRIQDQNFSRINANKILKGPVYLRKLVYDAFGDAVLFERNSSKENSNYHLLHKHIRDIIEQVNKDMQQYDNFELVMVVSSMGVQMLSTYIWDADHRQGIFENEAATSKNNLRNLRYLSTIGCNLPLFVSGSKEEETRAFDKRNDQFEWENFYDKNDVLGYPLQGLSASYNDLVTDHSINVGITLFSHLRYWKSKRYARALSNKLISIYHQ